MQSQMSGTIKKYGHTRRPSIGKSMPISTLLLNYSPSAVNNYESISRDGTSPDSERPPNIFHTTSSDYYSSEPTSALLDDELDAGDVNADDEFVFIVSPCERNNLRQHTTTPIDNSLDIEDLHDVINDDPIKKLCAMLCDKNCTKLKNLNLNVQQECNVKTPPIMHKNDRLNFLSGMLSNDTDPMTTSIYIPSSSINDYKSTEYDISSSKSMDVGPSIYIDEITSDINAFKMNKQEIHDKLAVAEALARTSMMTSPAAKRRLAARKIEMDVNSDPTAYYDEDNDYIPPKQLLLYLVR